VIVTYTLQQKNYNFIDVYSQLNGRRDGVVGIVIKLRVGPSRVRLPAGERDFSVLQSLRTGSEVHQPSYSIDTGNLSRGYGVRSVILTAHLHLASRLGMSRAIHLLALCFHGVERGKFTLFTFLFSRSQWRCGLRRRSAAARLLISWVRIPPGAWITICCECCVLSGRGLCEELITRPEESYRLMRRCV
jgi:hypothetical protein